MPVELIGGVNNAKSAANLAVEKRDQKIFTMQEYVERDQEHSDFAKRTAKQDVVGVMDNPMWLLYGLAIITAGSLYVVACVRMRTEKKRFDPKMRQVHSIDMRAGPPSVDRSN